MASGNAGNYQSIPALYPDDAPIPTTRGSLNLYMSLVDAQIYAVDFFKVHRPLGSGELFVDVPLSSAQIRTLNSAPVVAISAPGPGKLIRVKWATVQFTFGGIPFTNQLCQLKFPSTVNNNFHVAAAGGTIFARVADTFTQFTLTTFSDPILFLNEPLRIAATTNSLVGNGSAIVRVYYEIENY